MRKNKFNPFYSQFNTIKEWLKLLTPPISFWVDKRILQIASSSILEEKILLINLGKGKNLYQFQQTDLGVLAFPTDEIGEPIPITDQVYQFHFDKFLKCLASENKFDYSGDTFSDQDNIIGYLPIGDRKIVWICSFDKKGFNEHNTKLYFEKLKKEGYGFILLSDCIGRPPNIIDNKLDYVPLPFDSRKLKIDPYKFLKRPHCNNVNKVREFLKNRIVFFIDYELGKIYYKNNLVKIRKGKGKGTYVYRFFIALLKNPSKEYEMESFVEKEVGLSATHPNQDLSVRGRSFKRSIKGALKELASNDEIDELLPDTTREKQGNIKLNLSREDIFFF